MADFCYQCTFSMGWPPENNDMKGITTREDEENKVYAHVLCEGCGGTQVDHEGRCLYHDDDVCKERVNSWGEWWNGTIEP